MSLVFQLSEAVSLALHSMVLIAKYNEDIVNLNKITELTGASKNHLSKVMQRLTKSGLVESKRGPKGGFLLAKSAGEITLMEVYEAIEGKFITTTCLHHKIKCPFGSCIYGDSAKNFTKDFKDHFENKNLESFF